MCLTTSPSKHNHQVRIHRPCSCWEQRAIFLRPTIEPKLLQERHFRHLFSQHSTEINPIFTKNTCTCHTWVCQFCEVWPSFHKMGIV